MSVAHSASQPRSRHPIRGLSRLVNPIVLRFAGTRIMPLYGVLRHRGRRSGTIFQTPVVVRPTGDGFIVPMPWGETTDWYRNVRAAGACVVRWKGRDYPLAQPELLDLRTAGASFDGLQRGAMQRFGITQALRLRHQQMVSS